MNNSSNGLPASQPASNGAVQPPAPPPAPNILPYQGNVFIHIDLKGEDSYALLNRYFIIDLIESLCRVIIEG